MSQNDLGAPCCVVSPFLNLSVECNWKASTWLYLLEFSSKMLTVPGKSLWIFILASAAEIVRT